MEPKDHSNKEFNWSFDFRATTGNRTRTAGTTNRCTNRYTIVAMCRGKTVVMSSVVAIVIPIFILKVESFTRYTYHMGKESLVIVLALVFVLGAGIGFYAARLLF